MLLVKECYRYFFSGIGYMLVFKNNLQLELEWVKHTDA